MKTYVLRRILQLIPLLLGISFLVFLLMYLAPGDAAQRKLTSQGIAVSQETLERTRQEMGLDRPFLVQYGDWLIKALQGDLGESYRDGVSVMTKLLTCGGRTLLLMLYTLAVSLLLSLPLGVLSALRPESVLDRLVRFFSFVGNSIPGFLLGIFFMYFFCVKLGLFSVIAEGSLTGLFLPMLSLAIPLSGRLIRQFRAEVLEELSADYVTGMMSRGVKGRFILFGNVLRNAFPKLFTYIGLSLGVLMGGSVAVETLFSWNGLGKLVMDSITARDYPVIQGFVLFITVLYVLINLVTDLVQMALDPRLSEVQP